MNIIRIILLQNLKEEVSYKPLKRFKKLSKTLKIIWIVKKNEVKNQNKMIKIFLLKMRILINNLRKNRNKIILSYLKILLIVLNKTKMRKVERDV